MSLTIGGQAEPVSDLPLTYMTCKQEIHCESYDMHVEKRAGPSTVALDAAVLDESEVRNC